MKIKHTKYYLSLQQVPRKITYSLERGVFTAIFSPSSSSSLFLFWQAEQILAHRPLSNKQAPNSFYNSYLGNSVPHPLVVQETHQ